MADDHQMTQRLVDQVEKIARFRAALDEIAGTN
jgi:hypothetical protein